ncbi:countin-like protein [Tieghemostelium lacteum]|uniref:Countin-like protein n=1 Tax=Tieghemostelium lacteum TaxID=361077 RepID=A0A151Z8S8_TIELA|nr:countin-like protein [Tieghemostelium lacteum]|eukprot:KYQ90359.1 countin-like protein [Tieghemostelium lacteum]
MITCPNHKMKFTSNQFIYILFVFFIYLSLTTESKIIENQHYSISVSNEQTPVKSGPLLKEHLYRMLDLKYNSQYHLLTEGKQHTDIDACIVCVDFLNDYLPTLIKIVGEYGIIDSCSKICNLLNKSVEIDLCEVLCNAVGDDTFWKIFLLDDINPIYACELVKACEVTQYPAVNFLDSSVTPDRAEQGSTFQFDITFQVVNATGVGQFVYIVYYVREESKYIYSETFNNYLPGTYKISLPFQTAKNETFSDGSFPVQILMCSGECQTHTPYSVNLNQSTIAFKIENPKPTSPPPTETPTPSLTTSTTTSTTTSSTTSSPSPTPTPSVTVTPTPTPSTPGTASPTPPTPTPSYNTATGSATASTGGSTSGYSGGTTASNNNNNDNTQFFFNY